MKNMFFMEYFLHKMILKIVSMRVYRKEIGRKIELLKTCYLWKIFQHKIFCRLYNGCAQQRYKKTKIQIWNFYFFNGRLF